MLNEIQFIESSERLNGKMMKVFWNMLIKYHLFQIASVSVMSIQYILNHKAPKFIERLFESTQSTNNNLPLYKPQTEFFKRSFQQ